MYHSTVQYTKYINKKLKQVSFKATFELSLHDEFDVGDCSKVLELKHKNPYWKNTNKIFGLVSNLVSVLKQSPLW